jgi:hypothetical protein
MAMSKLEVAFTREWLDRLSGTMGEGDVLVGGQALAFWAIHFGLLPQDEAAFTKDADILGGFATVAAIAMSMNGRAAYPPARGFGTALHGQVEINIGVEGFLNIDILREVAGLDAAQVRRRAVPISFPTPPHTFAVMHPVDVFTSKLFNLSKLRDKQNPEGVWQALLAVRVAKSYLADLAGRNTDAAIKVANEIFKFGKSGQGLKVRGFGVEPFDALDGLVIDNPNFNEIGWPRMKAAIEDIRAAAKSATGPSMDEECGDFRP